MPAIDVDHVQPHRGDNTLRLNPLNLEGKCKRCHGVKSNLERLS